MMPYPADSKQGKYARRGGRARQDKAVGVKRSIPLRKSLGLYKKGVDLKDLK